ncbi:MAG: transposase, partial [Desulfovibrio sp.]|nr:transposase [Desulfovibrio sp.]
EATLGKCFTSELPPRLIGDKDYDSDKLDARLEEDRGIEIIAPDRKKRSQTQDGRPFRRYRRPWRVERPFAWLQNFRRIVVRYEFHGENFLDMVQLACIIILLRGF